MGAACSRHNGDMRLASLVFLVASRHHCLPVLGAHVLNESIPHPQGSDPRHLRDGRAAARRLSVNLVHQLDDGKRARHVTKPPPSHGVDLREPVDLPVKCIEEGIGRRRAARPCLSGNRSVVVQDILLCSHSLPHTMAPRIPGVSARTCPEYWRSLREGCCHS